jgi:hypothetical protein
LCTFSSKYLSETPLQHESHFLSWTYWWVVKDSNLRPSDLRYRKALIQPFYSTTYRGARCDLCTTMQDDA